MAKDITIRQLVNNVNTKLQEIYSKPIIKPNFGKYDTKNGRKVMTIGSVKDLILAEIGEYIHLSDERFDIYLYDSPLRFKTKRKKSGMINDWSHNDEMTIIEIYVTNESVLDKTVEQIETEKKAAQLNEAKQKKLEEEENYEQFNDMLAKFGMTFADFNSMKYKYEKLTFDQKMNMRGI